MPRALRSKSLIIPNTLKSGRPHKVKLAVVFQQLLLNPKVFCSPRSQGGPFSSFATGLLKSFDGSAWCKDFSVDIYFIYLPQKGLSPLVLR